MSRALRKNLERKVSGELEPQTVEPRRNVRREIKHPPKKAFDYRVIIDDGDRMFVVDGNIPSDKAARLYMNHCPDADVIDCYETGFCRYNVVSQSYEICDGGVGTFPVHIFHMED